MANKIEQMLEKLSGHLEHFDDDLAPFFADKSLAKGASILSSIHEFFGKEGLKQFTEWAVHPTSGFLPQTSRVKPLPTEIGELLEEFSQYHNEDVDKVNIRHNKRRIVIGNLEFSAYPERMAPLFAENGPGLPPNKERGTSLGYIAHENAKAEIKAEVKEAKRADRRLKMYHASYYMTADDYARAAAITLEAMLTPEKNRGVLSR